MIGQLIIPGWVCVIVTGLPLALALLLFVPRLRRTVYRLAGPVALPAAIMALLARPGHYGVSSAYLLGVSAGFDQIGRVFLFFCAVLWCLAGVHASGYVKAGPHRLRFYACFLAAMSGNFGLTVAHDAAGFYSLFAMMSFASYGLVVHSGEPFARRAGLVYIVLVVLGEALIFPAVTMAAAGAGSPLLPDIQRHLVTDPQRAAIALMVLLGFGIKAGVLPLHVWLPLAHPAAPTPASAVLSACMIKAGVLGWIRFLPLGTAALPGIGNACAAVGVVTVFWGLVAGLAQDHLKALLAYSSISKMGFLLLLIGLSLYEPALWTSASGAVAAYACFHALNKGALFLGCSVTPGARRRGLAAAGLVLMALSFAGFPLLAGAMAKLPLKDTLAHSSLPWADVLAGLLMPAAVLTALLVARFVVLAWPRGEEGGQAASSGEWIAWVGSLAALLAYPVVLAAFGELGKATYAWKPAYWWGSAWPVLLAAGVAAGVVRLGYRRPIAVPMGDILGVYLLMLTFATRLLPSQLRALLTRETSAAWNLAPSDAWKHRVLGLCARGEGAISHWTLCGLLYLMLIVAALLLLR